MKKKILALCLVVVLAITAVTGATLAYFTDTEEATNVFTIGNIDVKLIESYYHRESSYMDNIPDTIDEETNEPIYPKYNVGTVVEDTAIEESGEKYEDYLESQVLMPGVSINKMPYVKNTGDNDAYIRIRVMIPTYLDQNLVANSSVCTSSYKPGNGITPEFTIIPEEAYDATVNDYFFGDTVGEYNVYEFTRIEPLAPQEMTHWNVWNTIKMDPEVTNQDMERMISGGLINNMTFGVKVEVDAIQADSFASATEAWAAFDAQISNSVSAEDYSADAKDGFLTGEEE